MCKLREKRLIASGDMLYTLGSIIALWLCLQYYPAGFTSTRPPVVSHHLLVRFICASLIMI